MTKKISFALAVALLLILFNSCRQEFLTQENENQKNLKNYKVYTIDKKQITTDFKLFEKIAKLQNIFSQRMETGKSVQDSILDGAIIGINKVLVVEENGVKSYTFPLKRIFPNGKIENLVLKRNADSTFSGVLVQYNITEQEKELFNNWHSIDLKSKIKTYNIRKLAIKTNAKQVSETTNDGCITVNYDDGICTAGGGHHWGSNGCQGNPGQQPRQPHVLSIVQDPNCGDASGPNGGGPDGGSSGGGNSGGSVGGNPGGNNGGGGQNPKPGSNPPQSNPEPSNGGGGIDTMPFTDADFNYFSSNDLSDPAFQFYSQVSQFMLTQPQKVKDLNALNQYFFYFTYNYFTTNGINPVTKAFLSERLQLIANWYYQQNNYGQFAYGNQLNDNDRNTFSFWVYNYLVNHNPTATDYFKNNLSDLELIYMKVSSNESVNYANTTADKILSILIANSQNSVFNNDKKQFFNGLYEYFSDNNGSLEAQNFVTWALQFKEQNIEMNYFTFKRVFITPKEIEDGGENFNISKYNTIQFQKQSLPAFSSFNQKFPRDPNNPVYGMPSNQVYELVGGNMFTQNINGNPSYQNACAIRISRALNYTGQLIPVFFNDLGVQKSEKGKDLKNYILSAEAMLAYMLKAYPSPSYTYSGSDLKSVYKDIQGKNGIYIIIPNVRSELGASGHADLFYTNDCLVGGCHLGLPSGGSVYFWELKN